jgi:hypothetical protein
METIPVIYLSGALHVFRVKSDGNIHLKQNGRADYVTGLGESMMHLCLGRTLGSGV